MKCRIRRHFLSLNLLTVQAWKPFGESLSRIYATPWIERRRRMIAWASPRAHETKAYVARYFEFQQEFCALAAGVRLGIRRMLPDTDDPLLHAVLGYAWAST